MGSDHDVDVAGREPGVGPAPIGCAPAARQQLDLQRPLPAEPRFIGHPQVAEQRDHRVVMLLGKNLGGSHQRALEAALHRGEQGAKGHHRLARTHVALHQPVHGVRLGQIDDDLGDHPLLSAGQRERQAGQEPIDQLTAGGMGQPGRVTLQPALAPDQLELHPQQLVEHQAPPRLARFSHGGGPVDPVEGGVAAHEVESPQHGIRNRVEYPARLAAVEGLLHELGDLPRAHARLLRLRVYGNEATGAVPDEVDHRIGHLQGAPVPRRATVHNHLTSGLQAVLLPRLVEERELEPAGLVSDDDLDERPSLLDAPRRAALHATLHEDVLALGEFCDPGLLGAVDVAARVVLQQV